MKKVLIIEDDTQLRENTAELLELSNYRVYKASDGKQGIASAIAMPPDIIICDIMMPGVDGYGVLKALSKNESTKAIPFIYLTAKTERKDVRKGMDLGADDYITKPFNERELLSRVSVMLRIRDAEKKIETMALTDSLTGLYNLSLIHISEPTRLDLASRMPSSA